MTEDNLTRAEAQNRATQLSGVSYTVALDLTTGDENYNKDIWAARGTIEVEDIGQLSRMLNKLDVDVSAEADGQTSIQALGRTFAEYSTHRGPTEEEEKASDQVASDAQTLLERCRS